VAFISNGTTIIDAGAFSASLGSLVLIAEQTASGADSINFTSGINSTYPLYKFELINCRCSNNGRQIEFNLSTDGGSNYNVNKTATLFIAQQNKNGDGGDLSFSSAKSSSNTSGVSAINFTDGSSDGMSGEMFLFNPSSTTFVKHFIANSNGANDDNTVNNILTAGYANTSSAINAVTFDTFDGTIDGIFKLYGIKDS